MMAKPAEMDVVEMQAHTVTQEHAEFLEKTE